MMETRPPVPPFTGDAARRKVRLAEDAWNTRDPDRVVLVYTPDTEQGFMQRRFASINDLPITAAERKFFWPLGRRPDDHPGLGDLDL